MDALKYATGAAVPLESVLCTEELKRRPSRPPDYQAENQALLALAQELTNSPGSVLQRLVDIALELCRGHSAGISLLEEDGPPGRLSPRGRSFPLARGRRAVGAAGLEHHHAARLRPLRHGARSQHARCCSPMPIAITRSSPAFIRCWSKGCWCPSTSTAKLSARFG